MVNIDKDKCIGCGLCANIAPEVFEVENCKAKVKSNADTKENETKIKDAIDQCPVDAISK